ncbi:MAG: hypothetical protein HOW73_40325, partial [Polyangiaceae bacterium]|nr:hypothetical protein [Polyangiaceae bacterium]
MLNRLRSAPLALVVLSISAAGCSSQTGEPPATSAATATAAVSASEAASA